jgi:NifU-like protein involved in Fe-S cluster formation
VSADDPRYSAEVRRRFREAAGTGRAAGPGPVASGGAGDVEQGVRVEFDFAVEGNRVTAGAFRAHGCPHVVAAASWVAERLAGATRPELEGWDWHGVAAALDVPAAKYGRLIVIQDAVRAAARNWPGTAGSTV